MYQIYFFSFIIIPQVDTLSSTFFQCFVTPLENTIATAVRNQRSFEQQFIVRSKFFPPSRFYIFGNMNNNRVLNLVYMVDWKIIFIENRVLSWRRQKCTREYYYDRRGFFRQKLKFSWLKLSNKQTYYHRFFGFAFSKLVILTHCCG